MKTIKLAILATLFLVASNSLMANGSQEKHRVIVVSYHKSCFIGCGTVYVERQTATIPNHDGTSEEVILKTIKCTGFGFNKCPKDAGAVYEGEDDMNWVDIASGQMFDHAINQLDGGNNSGSHQQTFYNVNTGISHVFEVVWNYQEVTPGNWEQTIEVAILN